LAKQKARWCPGWGKAAWVASQRKCMAPGLNRPKVSKVDQERDYNYFDKTKGKTAVGIQKARKNTDYGIAQQQRQAPKHTKGK
jgi:hypothetical protein